MPNLIIIAGCNGAGKSTFASSFLPEHLTSFDYDRLFTEIYNSMQDSELREKFAHDQTLELLKSSVSQAILNRTDFCYETNFDTNPLFWAKKFKENNYILSLVFFCLDNQEIARHRVQVRTEFKGHFVNNETIDLKWKAGYKNVNLVHGFFDNILFVDNSKQSEVYTNILQIEKGCIELLSEKIPDYFKHRLPDIYQLLTTSS